MEKEKLTGRGFQLVEFTDDYDAKCSIQISSACPCDEKDKHGWIWLGIDDAKPQIMKSQAKKYGFTLPEGQEVSGWMPYPIPEDVLLSTRMHMNKDHVIDLVNRLQHWLDTGNVHYDQ